MYSYVVQCIFRRTLFRRAVKEKSITVCSETLRGFSWFGHISPQIIFRFALALFKYKEEEFLKLQDSTAIFKYLRCFTRTILDSR